MTLRGFLIVKVILEIHCEIFIYSIDIMIIHNIFLDVGLKPLSERSDWLKNIEENKKIHPEAEFILWDDEKVNNLIDTKFPQYKQMIFTFKHKFYLIDFIRYLILKEYGGIYMDLDTRMKQRLPENIKFLHGGAYAKEGINNNIISLPPDYIEKLLNFCCEEYNRITENDLYKTMPGRRFINSVSAGMFGRFCKRNNIVSDVNFRDYWWDSECISWVGLVNKRDYCKSVKLGCPPEV